MSNTAKEIEKLKAKREAIHNKIFDLYSKQGRISPRRLDMLNWQINQVQAQIVALSEVAA